MHDILADLDIRRREQPIAHAIWGGAGLRLCCY